MGSLNTSSFLQIIILKSGLGLGFLVSESSNILCSGVNLNFWRRQLVPSETIHIVPDTTKTFVTVSFV